MLTRATDTIQRGIATDPKAPPPSAGQNAETLALVASLRETVARQAQELEALQAQAAGGGGGEPVSPGGPMQSSKREYNPKRIYGKAQPQDTQCVIFPTCVVFSVRLIDGPAHRRTLVAKMNDEMKIESYRKLTL